MHVLLTNDDGFDAPGLKALSKSIRYWASQSELGSVQLTVVAPDQGRSECGHSVIRSGELKISETAKDWYAVSGTPVDCARVALNCICPDVDFVVSGINAGANVGIDILMSGTVAAAREAAIHGKPALAISHYRHPDIPKSWDHTPHWLTSVFDRFLQSSVNHSLPPAERSLNPAPESVQSPSPLWNVNLPAIPPDGETVPPIRTCFVDPIPLKRTGEIQPADTPATDSPLQETPVRLTSDFHGRQRQEGSDVQLCFSGSITISELTVF
ncbi:5'-nucleotidase /3'-nucleotidase /exopolyphosphatase [Neorhodopirellula lusitana]|uniref:5'-nucleotidase n=1 Tax=Neorhodopirellula lusitana TaxID=445327 RepID=A0ABY1PQC4_9BACT|nr:5'/3'-nucleotidase SurE [Neorhodopirellula lusitana]SMP42457.1 5'-nucleotidase /3'-nucleotidase /exopolyphosphatase [Neorhodopirellula lusitana]